MQPAPFARRVPMLALALAVAIVTATQILRPGLNQDVRYVLGALQTAGAAGLGWTEVWAHRPLTARGATALVAALSPEGFFAREITVRFWCVVIAAGAAVALWRGVRGRSTPRVAAWTALAVGAALAWAPGWDFAEPEWFAAALSVAAVGLALRSSAVAEDAGGRPRSPLAEEAGGRLEAMSTIVPGLLLGLVVILKFTTAATALAALIVIAMLSFRRAVRIAVATALSASGLLALTILVEPHEWQWLRDMPTLNPGFDPTNLPSVVEGLVNSAVVSPVTLTGLVAIGWLLLHRATRRAGLLSLLALAVLAVPFVVQQQNFLYHLAAVPVAAAGLTAAVAAHAGRIPPALPVTGVLGLAAGAGLFAMGPRTRASNWWVAAVVIAVVLVLGLGLLAVRRGIAGPAPVTVILVATACLAPLMVTVSPRTAYSFSLAHNRTTPAGNRDQAVAGADRLAEVRRVLPSGDSVVYLSFSAPYWVGNPTPCRYVSPTFLQRAGGDRGAEIAATASYAENLACLADPQARSVVLEPDWFSLDRARPDVRAALDRHFDCSRSAQVDGWVVCPAR